MQPMPKKNRNQNKTKCGRLLLEHEKVHQALIEPVLVIDSPCFSKKNAEEIVFEIPLSIPRLPVSWYSPAIDRALLPKRSVAMLLTREEEGILFRQYNYARLRLQKLQDKITHSRTPKQIDLQELVRWHDISTDKRAHIVERNLALVLAMAKRSWATGEYADLVAEGNVALIRAVDRFNCELGYKFSTYACRALTTAFNRFGRKQSKHRDAVPFEFDPDREPVHRNDFEVDVPQEHINALRNIVRSGEARLTTVEQEVLRYRFGLLSAHNPPRLTLEKAGRKLGISKERVRQVQIRALRKIRDVFETQFSVDLLAG